MIVHVSVRKRNKLGHEIWPTSILRHEVLLRIWWYQEVELVVESNLKAIAMVTACDIPTFLQHYTYVCRVHSSVRTQIE